MTLDAQTLFFSMWANVTLMSVALAVGVGVRRSGVRSWNTALLWQSAGWALIIVSTVAQGTARITSSLGSASLVASLSAMYVAAQHYLQQPARRAWVAGLPLLALVAHWVVFENFVVRICLINTVLGVQMMWMTWILRPWRELPTGRRWRWLAFGAIGTSGPLLLARAGLVLWSPQSYPSFSSNHWLNVGGLLVNNACITVGTLALLLAHRDEAERALHQLATMDGLTGTLNHRTLMERGTDQLQLALRHERPFTVMMFDLDHFKQVNDQHGHPAGDRVLALFAELLKSSVRQADLVGRYGGEEFCALLPLADTEAAVAIDRRLREQLAPAVHALVGFEVNFSAGAACVHPGGESLEQLVARADQALYAAKHQGRGQLVVDSAAACAPMPPPPEARLRLVSSPSRPSRGTRA